MPATCLQIQSEFFFYVSVFLEANGSPWSLTNLPRCDPETTFTFDTRHCDADEKDPLFTIHTWNYAEIAQPTEEQLRDISDEAIARQKKIINAYYEKKSLIAAMNQVRAAMSLPAMTNDDIAGIV